MTTDAAGARSRIATPLLTPLLTVSPLPAASTQVATVVALVAAARWVETTWLQPPVGWCVKRARAAGDFLRVGDVLSELRLVKTCNCTDLNRPSPRAFRSSNR